MKLSIITITYNAENYIKRTIESIVRQTEPVYEYILIDGGSIDHTNEIIEDYRAIFKKKGIEFIHLSEPDKGISDAFNKGIIRATGDYIGIINADDELLPNTARELQLFLHTCNTDIVYGNCIWIDEKNHISYIRKPKGNLNLLYYEMGILHPATFVSKKAYDRNGLYDERYKICMDEELLLRMYIAGESFSYIEKELSASRAGGVSDKNIVEAIKEGIELSKSYNCCPTIIFLFAVKKYINNRASTFLKKKGLYRPFKRISNKFPN